MNSRHVPSEGKRLTPEERIHHVLFAAADAPGRADDRLLDERVAASEDLAKIYGVPTEQIDQIMAAGGVTRVRELLGDPPPDPEEDTAT